MNDESVALGRVLGSEVVAFPRDRSWLIESWKIRKDRPKQRYETLISARGASQSTRHLALLRASGTWPNRPPRISTFALLRLRNGLLVRENKNRVDYILSTHGTFPGLPRSRYRDSVSPRTIRERTRTVGTFVKQDSRDRSRPTEHFPANDADASIDSTWNAQFRTIDSVDRLEICDR